MSVNAFSQITVTDSDLIDVGDVLYEAVDSVSGSTIQIGSSGANQTWDFSMLEENEVNSIEYLDPTSTPFGFMHPTANICTNEYGEYQYFNKSSSSVQIVGFDDQQALNPLTVLPLPLTYPMQFSTGPILVINETEENPFFPDSIAPLLTFGAAHTADSIKFEVVVENNFVVDGYGDVILPMGSFSALRVAVTSTNTQNMFIYCTDTLSGIASGWYPVPQQIFPSSGETEIDYFYQWWSNDASAGFTLVNIDVDEYGYNDGDGKVQFLTNNPTFIEENNDLEVSVFPIPAIDKLNIDTHYDEFVNLEVLDAAGRLVLKKDFLKATSIDLSDFAQGFYSVNFITTKGRLTKNILVE